VVFDKRCADAAVLNRLKPTARRPVRRPPGRQKTVIKNPETLRKLSI